jgi:hypothetical protein
MRTLVTSCTVTRRPAGNMGTQRRCWCCFQEIAARKHGRRREPAGSCSSALGEATRRRQGNEFSYSHFQLYAQACEVQCTMRGMRSRDIA